MKEPKIRFKGFQGEWENTPFSETFDSLKNNSLSRAELSDSGEVMNIHYGDVLIKYGECVDVIKEVETFVKDEEVAKKLHQSCAIKNGDVIFADAAEDNTVGKCSEVIANENDAIVSGLHTIACRPKKDFAPMYLGYYLNSNAYHDQLLPHIQGTKISSISKKAISQTEISSPIDKNEQRAIASYFQHLDSLIQSTTKKIESLKQVKAASLQSMFPQEGETTPRVRFKGFEGEWEKVSLGEETYPAGIKNYENLPLDSYSISNEFGFIPQNLQFENGGTMATADKRMYYIVSKNSFGYNPARINVGSLGYYSGNENVIVSSLYEIFKTSDRICDTFLLYWFKTSMFQKLIEQYQEGGVRFYFFYDKLCMCHTFVPSYEEQRAIASYFTSLDLQITLHTQRLEKLKQIKSACLDNMFV